MYSGGSSVSSLRARLIALMWWLINTAAVMRTMASTMLKRLSQSIGSAVVLVVVGCSRCAHAVWQGPPQSMPCSPWFCVLSAQLAQDWLVAGFVVSVPHCALSTQYLVCVPALQSVNGLQFQSSVQEHCC